MHSIRIGAWNPKSMIENYFSPKSPEQPRAITPPLFAAAQPNTPPTPLDPHKKFLMVFEKNLNEYFEKYLPDPQKSSQLPYAGILKIVRENGPSIIINRRKIFECNFNSAKKRGSLAEREQSQLVAHLLKSDPEALNRLDWFHRIPMYALKNVLEQTLNQFGCLESGTFKICEDRPHSYCIESNSDATKREGAPSELLVTVSVFLQRGPNAIPFYYSFKSPCIGCATVVPNSIGSQFFETVTPQKDVDVKTEELASIIEPLDSDDEYEIVNV